MAIWTETEQARPNGRFVRNLALSLSSGALLTVLGAGAAGAQDGGAAGTASDGAGAAQSGDATAVGNRSGTTKNQTAGASGTMGNLQVVDQTAAVGNVGVAVANTGGNVARGNTSVNTSTGNQTATSGLGPAVNSGASTNSSDGTARISTGDATAIGNQSTTTINQHSGTSAHGALSGILIVNQTGIVANAGVALANSGGNTATGNESVSTAGLLQTATTPLGLATNSGRVSNGSDGLATVHTGSASATGNQSDTKVLQSSAGDAGDDPGGALLVTEAGAVINFGAASADSGGNVATGNTSTATSEFAQTATTSPTPLAIVPVTSNAAEVANVSDGTASIRTGAASATGNHSGTELVQYGRGEADGVVPITQAALVVNAGAATASTGSNTAIGNDATGVLTGSQTSGVGGGTFLAGGIVNSNSADLSNALDGTATIDTGDATATGNSSHTAVDQTIDPNGIVLNPQFAVVLNAGIGQASTGTNAATGNASTSVVVPAQVANLVGPGNIVAGSIAASNSLTASNESDGTAAIATGDATATGNESNTHVGQLSNGSIDGLGVIVTPQVAVVANLGLAQASTGANTAVGNTSLSNAVSSQVAVTTAAGGADVIAAAALASNSGSLTNASDGSAEIDTGDATARGNVSSTELLQSSDAAVDGLGAIIAPQVGGVLNAGVGVASSGNNTATGNSSSNVSTVIQVATLSAGADLVAIGPFATSNSMDAGNSSDGHAKVKTGRATAEGNRSATTLVQSQDDTVEGLGLVVAPQIGVVANVGAGVANSGGNTALGNDADTITTTVQTAIATSATPGIILGGATVANQADAHSSSDGEACVCTGDATASGNISSTLLVQDLDLTVGTGVVVVVEAGGVLNAGVAVANSGNNSASGNLSLNTVTATQTSVIPDLLSGLPIAGPQVASNGVDAGSSSNGTALVASGNATAIGNESTTDFVQAATVDADFAISALIGGTANAGVGIANSGTNIGVGNDSTNNAVLGQIAVGAGVVSNQGEARNDSDGTAIIGNPEECLDEAVTPPAEDEDRPGAPGLPRTGAELETQAAVALMLLLLGFGLQRRSRRMA